MWPLRGTLGAVAKLPAKPPTEERPEEEFEQFEDLARRLIAVPKKDLDEVMEHERQERRNGNGSHK
jgi:hypothetical protein